MSRFVEVPSSEMFGMLERAGFSRSLGRSRAEVVYERAHHRNPSCKVLVYTSISTGEESARNVGTDAIRVVAIFDNGERSWGLAKLPRVHRTGTVDAVLDRTLSRMREAYGVINQRLKEGTVGR